MDPAATLRAVLAAQPKPTIKSYVYKAKHFHLPTYLVVPDVIRQLHMKVGEAAYAVIKSLVWFHGIRSKRFIAMCPETHGPVFDKHVRSIKHLLEWKEQTDPGDPTLAPAARIPRDVLGFSIDQRAYESYVNLYAHTLQHFFAIEWDTYTQRMDNIKHAACRQMDHHDFMAWLYWWDSEFRPNMKKWEIFVEDTKVPNWTDTVDELFDLVIKCVEGEEHWNAEQDVPRFAAPQITLPGGVVLRRSTRHRPFFF